MKLLFVAGGLVAITLALRLMVRDVRRIGGRPTVAALIGPVVSLAILGLALYLARGMGWFSIPVVALAFVPFGLSTRLSLFATRDRRERREVVAPAVAPTRRSRAAELLMWPLMVVVVLFAAALGAAAAIVASWR